MLNQGACQTSRATVAMAISNDFDLFANAPPAVRSRYLFETAITPAPVTSQRFSGSDEVPDRG